MIGRALRLIVIFALLAPMARAGDWPLGGAADLKFETSSFMATTLDSDPASLSDDAALSGAYGPFNRAWEESGKGAWYIESQRFGADVIAAGLALHRRDLVDKGIHILNWGFDQQGAGGSFHCEDAFHSTAFFLEAAARTALLLQASEFHEAYGSWIIGVKPKLLEAAKWMTSPAIESAGLKGDEPYTHRYYLDADAIGFVGLLAGDTELVAESARLVRQGMEKQDQSGINPEKGGHDTSYQAVGLVFALRYYSILADDLPRQSIKAMLSKGLGWLRTRVRADGSVNQAGNTRTGAGQETGRDGKSKTMSYVSAARAFAYWAQVFPNPRYQELGMRLYRYSKEHHQ